MFLPLTYARSYFYSYLHPYVYNYISAHILDKPFFGSVFSILICVSQNITKLVDFHPSFTLPQSAESHCQRILVDHVFHYYTRSLRNLEQISTRLPHITAVGQCRIPANCASEYNRHSCPQDQMVLSSPIFQLVPLRI